MKIKKNQQSQITAFFAEKLIGYVCTCMYVIFVIVL